MAHLQQNPLGSGAAVGGELFTPAAGIVGDPPVPHIAAAVAAAVAAKAAPKAPAVVAKAAAKAAAKAHAKAPPGIPVAAGAHAAGPPAAAGLNAGLGVGSDAGLNGYPVFPGAAPKAAPKAAAKAAVPGVNPAAAVVPGEDVDEDSSPSNASLASDPDLDEAEFADYFHTVGPDFEAGLQPPPPPPAMPKSAPTAPHHHFSNAGGGQNHHSFGQNPFASGPQNAGGLQHIFLSIPSPTMDSNLENDNMKFKLEEGSGSFLDLLFGYKTRISCDLHRVSPYPSVKDLVGAPVRAAPDPDIHTKSEVFVRNIKLESLKYENEFISEVPDAIKDTSSHLDLKVFLLHTC